MTQDRDQDENATAQDEEAVATAQAETEANADGEAAAEAETPDGAEGTEPAEPESPEQQIEALQQALIAAQASAAAAEDRALRAAAEAENTRRRADRSIENAHKYALEKFVGDLLPAVDSFERAAEAAEQAQAESGDVQAIAEGVSLSLKLLREAMEKQGIVVVDPIGAPFDPQEHEAMSMIEKPDAEPGAVVEVFQKGYTVNGRLARPARVIVAKAPAPPAENEADGNA